MCRAINWLGRADWVLAAIALLGLARRPWGIPFGLPHSYHADENVPVSIALRMLHTGDLNPRFFNWTPLLIYLNAALYGLDFCRTADRWFVTPTDLPLPPEMPPGTYRVEVGWLTFPTLARLTVTGAHSKPRGDLFLLPAPVMVSR